MKKKCIVCGNYFPFREMMYVDSGIICQSCFDDNYTTCYGCGCVVSNEEVIDVNGRLYCGSCFNDIFFVCDDCGEYDYNDKRRYTRTHSICEYCADEYYAYCPSCDYYADKDDGHYDEDGEFTCRECFKDNRLKSKPSSTEEIGEITAILLSPPKNYNLMHNPYNHNDIFLDEIIECVGPAKNPIYVYGLLNRPEYGITCTEDVIKRLEGSYLDYIGDVAYLNTPIGNIKVVKVGGVKNLGICYDLRKYCPGYIVKMLKDITNAINTVPCSV